MILKNRRKEAKLTQKEMAIKCGVSPQFICRIENGKDRCPLYIKIKYLELSNDKK